MNWRQAATAAVLACSLNVAEAQMQDAELSGLLLTRATAWQTLQAEGRLTMETVTALNNDFLAQIDQSTLTVDQIEMLAAQNAFLGVTDLTVVSATLEEAGKAKDVTGAKATVVLRQVTNAQDAEGAAAMLEHPGVIDLMRTDSGGAVMQLLGAGASAMTPEQRAAVYRFLEALPADSSDATLSFSQFPIGALADSVAKEQQDMHAAAIEHVRTVAAARLETATDPQAQEGLTRLVSFLSGRYAQGRLIGSPMPTLDVTWSSDEALTSFADLRGKVVVLDFWATWCGPCISSFPNVKHLQDHYEGHDVVIVGVTSLQGAVVNGPDGGQIFCQGDPEKEYAETARFIEFRQMSWPVVFTEQAVFNPDFGVSGIPHVAIIDPSGVVRANGLHPASPLEAKTEIIDGLLAEAGLPTPRPETPAGDG